MMRGRCKWFSDEKGYGFIQSTDGKDIFVHYSALKMQGRKKLNEGDEVEFETESSNKGLRAINVIVKGASYGA